MKADTSASQAPRELSSELTLPQRPEIAATHTEKVDALLGFCQRAVELQTTLRFRPSQQTFDFSTYTAVLNEMRPQGDLKAASTTPPSVASLRSPEAIATDLATLITAQLSSPLVAEDLGYWLAVTSALSAATRSTMPKVSSDIAQAQSAILQLRTESPTHYRQCRG